MSLYVRTRTKVDGTDVFGDWTTFSFTLDDTAIVGPQIVELHLAYDSGVSNTDNITNDPSITGKILYGDVPGNRLIEIDTNNDGTRDATIRTDSQGSFIYFPFGLAAGPHTIAARATLENGPLAGFTTPG